VRRHTADGQWFAEHSALDGLRVAANLDDGQVFAVVARTPAIYIATMKGFFPRERDSEWTWRWMGQDAAWTIVNTSAQPIVTTLGIELSAFHRARRLELLLDGRHVQTFVVEPPRRIYQVGPLTVIPGGHELAFHPAEGPTVAGDVINNGDRRPLSFALGTWHWTVRGEQPRRRGPLTGISGPGSASVFPTWLGPFRRAITRTTNDVCSPSTSPHSRA
jgi:hypothetical protein